MQLCGVRPYFSDKFHITKHPKYKYPSDADPKNGALRKPPTLPCGGDHMLTACQPAADAAERIECVFDIFMIAGSESTSCFCSLISHQQRRAGLPTVGAAH